MVGNSQLETGRDLRLETGEWSNGRNRENIWVRGGFTILYRRNIPPSSGLIQKSRNDSDQKRWFLEDSIFAIIVF